MNEGQELSLKSALEELEKPKNVIDPTGNPVGDALLRFGFRHTRDNNNLMVKQLRWERWAIFSDLSQEIWRGMGDISGVAIWPSEQMADDLGTELEPFIESFMMGLWVWKVPVFWIPKWQDMEPEPVTNFPYPPLADDDDMEMGPITPLIIPGRQMGGSPLVDF